MIPGTRNNPTAFFLLSPALLLQLTGHSFFSTPLYFFFLSVRDSRCSFLLSLELPEQPSATIRFDKYLVPTPRYLPTYHTKVALECTYCLVFWYGVQYGSTGGEILPKYSKVGRGIRRHLCSATVTATATASTNLRNLGNQGLGDS